MVTTTISFALAAVGIAACCGKIGGVPDSISAMVYELPKKWQWTWTVWLCLVAMLLMPDLAERCGWIGWLTVVCLCGAAVTPIIQQETRRWHNVMGVMAGWLSQLCVWFVCPWWLLVWTVMLALMMGTLGAYNDTDEPAVADGKGLLVAEVICAVSVFGALLC